MTGDYRRALQVAQQAAAEARLVLLAECGRPDGPRGADGYCPADEAAERLIRQRLLAAFPAWGYLGEETGSQAAAPGERHRWLVDPNDGTVAMLRGYRGHAVSIAVLRDGVPVLGVVHAVDAPDDDGESFAWAEGCGPLCRDGQPVQRPPWPSQLGSSDVVLLPQGSDRHPVGYLARVAPARFRAVTSIAYRLALVAAGDGVATISLNSPGAVDYAAGHALLRSVGGRLIDETGADVRYGPDGHSSTRACFGGAPAVVAELAQAEWRSARGSGFGPATPLPGFEQLRLIRGLPVDQTAALERAQGCLLGQLAGDALGSLAEFQRPAEIARAYPQGPRLLAESGVWQTMAGQPTDDSELAMMLARTLAQRGRYDQEAVAQVYARWCHGWTHREEPMPCDHAWCRPFDIGNATSQALGAISAADLRGGTAARAAQSAASRATQANGALMRVSPLGIWGSQRPLVEVAQAARLDAQLTHPDPVCQDASALLAVTIAQAICHRPDARALVDWAMAWGGQAGLASAVVAAVERARQEPPADYLAQAGWVLVALQNAFYQLGHAPSLEDGVVATVRAGGDTDTNAAICGALLGAVAGRRAVPVQWQQALLSCRPFPGHPAVWRPRPAMFWPADALALAERLLSPES